MATGGSKWMLSGSGDITGSAPSLGRLARHIGGRRGYTAVSEIAIGAGAGLIAVGMRFVLPLRPDQLPTATVVVMLAVVTTFVGLWGGIATAVIGGALSWYLFFNPMTWSLDDEAWVPLLGYGLVALVILITSHLYRGSEQLHHQREVARLQAQADTAQLFARELAHRLGNTLAIVQSVALQTIGRDTPLARKFAGRLKALSDANHLLAEHVEVPTANVTDVVEAALRPFDERDKRISIDSVDVAIPAQQVLTLALTLHELGTNASKYGALSTSEGSVAVSIEDTGELLKLTWKETGGPPVASPESEGFGTKLLRRAGVTSGLQFEPDGLRCTMDIRKAPREL